MSDTHTRIEHAEATRAIPRDLRSALKALGLAARRCRCGQPAILARRRGHTLMMLCRACADNDDLNRQLADLREWRRGMK